MRKNIKCSHSETEEPNKLISHPKNPNTHPQKQIDLLAKIIKHQGFRNPIVVSKRSGFVIAGHARLKAAIALGLDQVPVDYQDFETEADEWAHLIADNKLAELAQSDDSMLADLLHELTNDGIDAELAGFGEEDLSDLLETFEEGTVDTEPQTDKAEELCNKWKVESGQLWQLGNHKIICGDSTSIQIVSKLLGDEKPNLMVTDPPYGVNYEPTWRSSLSKNNHNISTGIVLNDDNADWSEAWKLFEGDVAYVWCAPGPLQITTFDSLTKTNFLIRDQIIWNKSSLVLGRGHYHKKHEPCWYAVRKGASANWQGDRSQSTVWDIPKPQKSETGHSTQKPIECMARPIRNNSKKGDLIYEPFSGSGTTLIACENLHRQCRAIELNPPYVAIAIERWAQATGGEPKLL
tara:strand:- start:772 stop:1989 length:1218 start_codon:yes stop_codon:yes gene_type:complete